MFNSDVSTPTYDTLSQTERGMDSCSWSTQYRSENQIVKYIKDNMTTVDINGKAVEYLRDGLSSASLSENPVSFVERHGDAL